MKIKLSKVYQKNQSQILKKVAKKVQKNQLKNRAKSSEKINLKTMKFLRIALLRNLVHQLIFLKVKNPHNFMKDHKTKGEKGKSKEKNFEIPHRMRAIR